MAQRVIVGRHPDGAVGLFISRPGVNVGDVGSGDYNNLWFSTQFANVGTVLAKGTCGLNQDVWFGDPGYVPLIRFEEWTGSAAITYPNFGFPFSANGRFYRADWTRYQLGHLARNGFRIIKRDPATDSGAVSPTFRWLAYTIPAWG
ncbi:hypothetical protein [Methylobacterium oxalidis]|uniref:Uncharacterized protein n=1 Tax=Methylobacterium oxalidis TaxID=944322 RepID=A0A512J6P8_9HYPH|nr:hypothetical protein [Methylobacterium oxalidis]GEP05572.1 hypothetical protein MOX02_36100 [Methylobacterium oxalidis]GJE32701.1 hypothetical protein LDDCCGHA_2889 [Methylobacterium oxalidis]GLS65447.1 hypothetical protein GCM10007888_38290 [Methylobacterium oxalidis]